MILKNIRTIALLCFLIAVSACTPFIKDEQVEQVKRYERYIYTLKKDVIIDDVIRLRKGEVVKIYIVTSDAYIKVYAYPQHESYLKADHILTVYMYEDEFPKQKFVEERFEEVLLTWLEEKENIEEGEVSDQ